MTYVTEDELQEHLTSQTCMLCLSLNEFLQPSKERRTRVCRHCAAAVDCDGAEWFVEDERLSEDNKNNSSDDSTIAAQLGVKVEGVSPLQSWLNEVRKCGGWRERLSAIERMQARQGQLADDGSVVDGSKGTGSFSANRDVQAAVLFYRITAHSLKHGTRPAAFFPKPRDKRSLEQLYQGA